MADLEQTPPASSIDAEALERYLAGAGTPGERAGVETWIDGDARRRRLVRVLREGLDVHDGVPVAIDPAGEWRRFVKHRLGGAGLGASPASYAGAGTSPWKGAAHWSGRVPSALGWRIGRWWGIGVVVALAAVVLRRELRPAADRPTAVPHRTYATAAGQRAMLVLSDGSRVTLAPRTTLVVPADFGRLGRTVELRGQAYFSVTPAAERPFVVRTGDVVTRVLGTTFDIRHYSRDPDVRVTVATGKVAVSGPRRAPVTLASGTQGRFADSATNVSAVQDLEPYTGWTDGHLRFRRAPVADVLATLSRWYGIEFRLSDPALATQHVTTALDYSATTDLVVALERLLDVSAVATTTDTGTVITLHPRHPAVRVAPDRREAGRNLSSPSIPGVGR